MMIASLTSIIFNTAWYYYTNCDKTNKFSIIKLVKLCIKTSDKDFNNESKSTTNKHVIDVISV